jgi:tetratricopeptide (TPR) repeat protein
MDKSNKNIDKDIENMLHQLSHTKEDKELKDRWKQILSDDYNVKRSPAKPKTKYLKPFLAVIALVTIAVIAFYYISLPKIENGSKKDTDYLIAEVQILTNPIYDHRGNEQTKDNYSSRAYSMLKANNYKQAIEIYTNAKNNTKLNEYDTYHLGLAYLKNGNYENSISTLQKLKVK